MRMLANFLFQSYYNYRFRQIEQFIDQPHQATAAGIRQPPGCRRQNKMGQPIRVFQYQKPGTVQQPRTRTGLRFPQALYPTHDGGRGRRPLAGSGDPILQIVGHHQR